SEGQRELPDRDRPVATSLVEHLCCPDCRAGLEAAGAGLRCAGCGTSFPAEYGVPILYPTRAADEDRLTADAPDRLCGEAGGRRRAVARLMRRLGRNERPPGWLRRGAWRLERTLRFRAA